MTQITAVMVKELRDRTGLGMSKCKEALEHANGDMELAIENLRKSGMASAVKKEGRETKEGMTAFATQNGVYALIEANAETDFVVKSEPFQQFAKNIAIEVAATTPVSLADLMNQPYSQDSSITVDQHRALVMQNVGENIQVKRIYHVKQGANDSIAIYSHMGGKIGVLVEIEGAKGQEALAYDLAMHIAAEAPEYLDQQSVPAEIIEKERDIAKEQVKGKPEAIVDKIVDGKIQAYCAQVCLVNQKYIKDPSLSIQELLDKRSKEIGSPLKVRNFVRWQIGA